MMLISTMTPYDDCFSCSFEQFKPNLYFSSYCTFHVIQSWHGTLNMGVGMGVQSAQTLEITALSVLGIGMTNICINTCVARTR